MVLDVLDEIEEDRRGLEDLRQSKGWMEPGRMGSLGFGEKQIERD